LARDIAALPDAQRWQIATEALVSELPGLLYQLERYRDLWGEEYRKLLEKISKLESGAVEVREWPVERLSVISSGFSLDHFTRNIAAAGHRILETVRGSQGATYELYYREFLWYDIISRPRTPKHRLLRAAERLNELESPETAGSWGVTKWSPALRFVASGPRAARKVQCDEPLGYSSLSLETVESIIREELQRLDDRVIL
jgi:hypothetical protein